MAQLGRRAPTVILAAAVVGAVWLALAANTGREPRSQLSPGSAPTATPPNPLQIEAIRARTYSGGPITTVRQLGVQGRHSDSVIRFGADGLTEYARASTPAGPAPASGWPVVILLHGYIDPAAWRTDTTAYADLMGALADAGYLVVRPDYRGHGDSQGTPAGGHFAPDYAYDTLNLVASLKQYPGVNPARIGLIGHSLGGHVALRAAVASPDVKATVVMAGVVGSMYDIFYNWPNSPAPRDEPRSLVQGARQRLVEQYGDPKSNPAFWDGISAINYVKYIAGAVQIHHSEADSVVPRLFADHLNDALVAASRPVEYHRYPGDDHQLTANRSELMRHLMNFFGNHL